MWFPANLCNLYASKERKGIERPIGASMKLEIVPLCEDCVVNGSAWLIQIKVK